MKYLFLIMVSLFFIGCETTTEPKNNEVQVSVNDIGNKPIYCKRVWHNDPYSYSTYTAQYATVVDSIKISNGFGKFIVETCKDSIWSLGTYTEIKFIRLQGIA